VEHQHKAKKNGAAQRSSSDHSSAVGIVRESSRVHTARLLKSLSRKERERERERERGKVKTERAVSSVLSLYVQKRTQCVYVYEDAIEEETEETHRERERGERENGRGGVCLDAAKAGGASAESSASAA
jgi:hypothetical protein